MNDRRSVGGVLYGMLLLTLAGCATATAPTGKATVMGPPIAPAAAGPVKNAAAASVKPVETVAPIPTPMETFRALEPSESAKTTPLFAGKPPDTDARINRLETSVQDLRNDFDTVMPTIVRMAAMEKDMRDLITQLHTLTNPAGAAVPPLADPAVDPTGDPPANASAAAAGSGPIPASGPLAAAAGTAAETDAAAKKNG